ncbi:hypothetical protein BSL78_19214 [Apostichopus japonicus]|uniref:Integrase zinc-binding domain-containing protein n=1 Tax=Stichopus japonicus TaxID=307972 RepID=A0A2G8K7H9_STIJA|nr:hypothetical protein BSL78_19214 [Apostichopus japonicus]
MLIRLQGYNFSIKHSPGQDNLLADSLSRLPSICNKQAIDLDLRVDFIQFSLKKQDELKQQTKQDTVLSALVEVIITGWPDSIKDVQSDLRQVWSYRDELTVCDRVILKGFQIVIPKQMQSGILQKLHTSHLGQQKTKLLARECVYWNNITNVLKEWSSHAQHANTATSETTSTARDSYKTMEHICHGSVQVELKGKQWLIVVDYYSK